MLDKEFLTKQKRKDLTDEEIFESNTMRDYLTVKAKAVHRDFHNPLIPIEVIYKPKVPYIAKTDNSLYSINAGNEMFCGTTLEKLNLVCGALYHEIGHRLFTNFTATIMSQQAFLNGTLYPSEPKVSLLYRERLENLKEYISVPRQARKICSVYSFLSNILEDGRIEYWLMSYSERYKTLGDGLESIRQKTYDDLDPYAALVKKVEDGDMLSLECLFQILLHYVRFGEIKGIKPENFKDPIPEIFNSIQDDTDICVEAIKSVDFYSSLNRIVVILWPQIKEYLDTLEEDENEDEKSENEKENSSGNNGENEDDETSESESGKAASSLANQIAERLSKLQGQGPSSEIDEEMAGDGSDDANVASMLNDEQEKGLGGTPQRLPYTRTTSITSKGTGQIEKINHYIDEDPMTKVDLNHIKNAVTEEKVDEELEKIIRDDLEKCDESIDYGKAHRNVDCGIFRHDVTEADKLEYARISPPLVRIAKNLAKRTDFFTDDESPVTVKSQLYGKRFNPSAAARSDYRHFSKKIILEEAPTIAVGVLIDESGSMDGIRSQSAKAMAVTLYEYCRQMDIPVAIYGHSTGSAGVHLYIYSDFDKVDPNDRYRLMNISARMSNRDGYALRFLKRRLEEQDASSKLLIIVSDGQPAAYGYTGKAAAADLSDIAKSCEKEGIALVAAAIGDDKPQIKGIYGERHFLDITNLEKMPILLTNQIKRLLK